MKPGWLRSTYLKHFSQPAKDRPIYRLIDGGKISSISEFGLECGTRMRRMIEGTLSHHPRQRIRYAGFDLFEARVSTTAGLTLKQTHRELKSIGIQFRLVPGDIIAGLLRIANTLPGTDLVVISGEVDHAALEAGWFYFPRMLHPNSVVMVETGNVRPEFHVLNYTQVCELSTPAVSVVRRAA